MQFHQIRSATAIITCAGVRFLIDPMLSPKGAFPGFEGTPNAHLSNPTVELPFSIEQILAVDAVIVTHVHPDHWDDTAKERIPKNKPLFAQNERDQEYIRAAGFSDVRVLGEHGEYKGVTLIKTAGQHGSDAIMAVPPAREMLGEVCGVVFKHPDEKTMYLAGDTIWNSHVQQAIACYAPEVIILNAGDAQITGLGSIIMNKEDVLTVHRAAPRATLIATHMEAVNHAMLSRGELRAFALENKMSDCLLIPADGETCEL